MTCCLFKDCFNRSSPFTSLTFFKLPKDGRRRELWLHRSGSEDLVPSARSLVCEVHFEESHLRRQFHRTTLSADAVPLDYRLRKKLLDAEKNQDTTVINQSAPTDSADEIYTIVEADYELVVENETAHDSPQIESLDNVQADDCVDVESIVHSETSEPGSCRSSPELLVEPSKRKNDRETSRNINEPIAEQNNKKIKTIDPQFGNETCVTSSSASATEEEISGSKSPIVEQSKQQEVRHVQPPTSTTGRMSEEEYFALSLVGPLQRLSPEKRAIAKMKILTYLVQLECGMDAQLSQ
ncbi:uncharacterized protein LOC131679473 [Topomyia yanbarensis]|uniref:uncharacterized protein LOC131679473 n=1 Tax=Topomyia yanbarensis TaxID=2498891 RepID=UPI00273C13F9|nr:uncharacterized protein LOC131679473 [Topomyia yanbarensis]